MLNPRLTSTWLMTSPLPPEKPVIFGELGVAVQEKFVPATSDVILIFGDVEEQIVEVSGLFEDRKSTRLNSSLRMVLSICNIRRAGCCGPGEICPGDIRCDIDIRRC